MSYLTEALEQLDLKKKMKESMNMPSKNNRKLIESKNRNTLKEDWREYLTDKSYDVEKSWRGHIIGIDELDDEIDCGEITYHGDKDGWETYSERRIDRLKKRYPDFQRFYLEDRTNWKNSSFFSDLDDGEDIVDILVDELEGEGYKESPISEDNVAKLIIDRFEFCDVDDVEKVENIIETLKELGIKIN